MRRAAKIDINQPEIVKALRQIGVSVQPLHAVGGGCPDILCGYHGRNYLIEIKTIESWKNGDKLTRDQITWHDAWDGSVHLAFNPEDALAIIRGKENGK